MTTAVLERLEAVREPDAERMPRKELMLPCDDAPVEWLLLSRPMTRSQVGAEARRSVSGCGPASFSSAAGGWSRGHSGPSPSPKPEPISDRTSSEAQSTPRALRLRLRLRLRPVARSGRRADACFRPWAALGGSQTSGKRNGWPMAGTRALGFGSLCQLAARNRQAEKTRNPKKARAPARRSFYSIP